MKCGHGNIHADCLASWLAEQRRRKVQESCPVCRARIDADFVTIVSVSGMTDCDPKEKYIIIERGDVSYYRYDGAIRPEREDSRARISQLG